MDVSIRKKSNIIFYIFIIFAIILLPIVNSFLGIDMVDTGYYLYQYEAPISDYGVYTSFLANLIGAAWLKVFGFLGLWGLNILEILLEWLQCLVIYVTFKNYFGKRNVLVSCGIAMILISTYVNVFNYHQLNMFLCTLMLCLMYTGLKKERQYFFVFSGMTGMFAVFNRMPSILGILCFACIIYWGLFISKNRRKTIKYTFLFSLGYFIMMFLIFGFLKCLDFITQLNILERVLNEVLRLNNLGKNGGAAYGSSSMITNFISDNIHAVLAALLFILCGALILAAAQWRIYKNNVVSKILFILVCLFMLPLIYYAIYVVGNAPEFIQLTSFNWFVYGLCFTISIAYILLGIFPKKKEYGWSGLLLMMSMALILLCCAGSAARLKHVILGLWIILPFAIDQSIKFCKKDSTSFHIIKKSISICKKAKIQTFVYISAILVLTVVNFVRVTNNFDSPNRLELTATIDSEKVRFLRTTEREASATNELLEELRSQQDRPLMVLGNAVIVYSLADMESYVKPWVSGTSYTADDFAYHLESEIQWKNKPLPIIVWSRTNPYEGFSEEQYEELLEREANNNYSGKREIVEEFMNRFEYNKVFENDYFIIYDTEVEEW